MSQQQEQIFIEDYSPRTFLIYPNKLNDKEYHKLKDYLHTLFPYLYQLFPEDAAEKILYNVHSSKESRKSYYDIVTSKYASKFFLGDRQLTADEFVELSINYISPYKERKEEFARMLKDLYYKPYQDDKKFSVKETPDFLNQEIEEWAEVVNLMTAHLEPYNQEPVMLAAGLADRSPSNSYEILRGKGKTMSGKPYPPLIYRTKELADFLARGHTSVVELSPMIISVDNATRYDMFMLNSQYNYEFRGSEEKSGRDVPLLHHTIQPEFSKDEKYRTMLSEFTKELKKLYDIEFDGKKLPKEDVRYAALLCSKTSTTISINPFNLSQLAAYVKSDSNATEGFRQFVEKIVFSATDVLPEFAPKAEESGIKAGYNSPPRYLEDILSENMFESLYTLMKNKVQVYNVEVPERLRGKKFNMRDHALKSIKIRYFAYGSLSMAAQHMRHNYGTQFFESLGSAARAWDIIEPPSISEHEESAKLFEHTTSLARDLYEHTKHLGNASVYNCPLGIGIKIMAELNGYSDLNFQAQRIEEGAQWEIRRIARMKHNQVEESEEGSGFYTNNLSDILRTYVENGQAIESDGRIFFNLEKIRHKGQMQK